MRSAESALPLRHAVALGLLQGPAELLPISSSGHTTLLPWLAGWPYERLDGELRKSFEVTLHAGAGAALALVMRREIGCMLAHMTPRRATALSLSLAPAAIAGFVLRGAIERHLGGPRSVAVGLAGGAVAMALADLLVSSDRVSRDAGAGDGLALGLAQAGALIPGVSRSGATLTAARARGFDRAGAQSLSWQTGLPVILAAGVLKGARLPRAPIHPAARAPLLAGGVSAFLSTLLSAGLMRRGMREGHSLLPYSLYRCLLAGVVLMRLRRDGPRREEAAR